MFVSEGMIYKAVNKYVYICKCECVNVCLEEVRVEYMYIYQDKYLDHHEPHSIPVSGGNATNSLFDILFFLLNAKFF